VFGHGRRAEEIDERIDHLLAAVFVADDADRLSEAFALFRREPSVADHPAPARGGPPWARPLLVGPDRARVTAAEGWSFGSLDADGSIFRVVTFEGLVPGPPGGRS
jgi:hypothetical protein